MDNERARQVASELLLYESGRTETVYFHGNSMLPFLQDGDALRVEPVDWQDIVPGDIITFRLLDHFPTLRVVRIRGDRLELRGDNWGNRRFVAYREFVLGRVTARTRANRVLGRSSLEWRWATNYVLHRSKPRSGAARLRRAVRQRIKPKPQSSAAVRFLRPPNIQVNVSSHCNLKCRMCPYLEIHPDPAHLKYMTAETFERLVPLIQEIGAVHFSGSGEPLFNRHLFDFIARVRECAPHAVIDLTTNGTLLTAERARRLIELRVDKLHVSFDGMPGRVETIRKNINGEKVMENLDSLKRLKQNANTKFPSVQINYMGGYGTYRDLCDFIGYVRNVGVAEIQLLELQPATREDLETNLVSGTREDNGHALRTAVMLAHYYNIALHLPFITSNACHFPSNPHIAEDGVVYPCCYLDYDGRQLYDGETHHFPPMPLGNINVMTFDSIWDSPGYRAFREKTAQGKFDSVCQTCYDLRARSSDHLKKILGNA